MSDRAPAPEPWYAGGLCFSCTGCGDCCRHEEGYVWVSPERIASIARFLGMDHEQVMARYVRRVGRRLSLVEKPNLDCVFWDNGCTIYPVRPTQCRTYPFWPENVESKEDWEAESEGCPGIDRGRRYSREEIDTLGRGVGETGTPKENNRGGAP